MLMLAEPGIDAEFATCVPEAAAGCRLTVADRRVASALALAEPGALAKARTLVCFLQIHLHRPTAIT